VASVGTGLARTAPTRSRAGLAGRISPLALILLAGVVARLALWLCFDNQPTHIWDEGEYTALAASLVQRGEFALQAGQPSSHRPPLYPVAIAGAYAAFGVGNLQAVRLLQAGLSLLNVLLLYRLGGTLFDRRVGTVAAGLYCFYPSLLGFNNLLLTEVLFTFLLCLACSVLIRSVQRASLLDLAGAGALVGLAALTRSVVIFLPALLVPFLLLAWTGSLRRRVLAAAVLVATFAVVVAPWVVRNTRLERTFVTIDTMGGRNFMMGNYRFTPLYRAWDAVSLQGGQFWYSQLLRVHPEARTATQGQIDKLALREGMIFVWQHPGLTLQRDVVKFVQFWGLERELIAGAAAGYFGALSRPAVVLLTLLIFGTFRAAMVAGLFGMVMAPPADRRAHALLLLVVGVICLVHTLTFGHSRYHLPLMPFVLLYAASAAAQPRQIWAGRGHRSFGLAAGLSGLFLLGRLWEVVVVDGERYWSLLRSVS
jgi:4-amino-4-deoxy-L-arabinose transferase-like glycosyltransferase